ncbi:MAG TPA: RNA pseudouridine synthase, partial [Paraburkholderia sp.]
DAMARLAVLVELPGLIVVDKPAGMPSQPLRAGERGTAANGIAARWPECAALGAPDVRDGGLAHRLDIGTSGALAAARTPDSYAALRAAFARGAVDKQYLAITCGRPAATSCEAPLAQRGDHVAIDAAGLDAVTEFVVERANATHALVRCTARTGRMHQIRAHLAHVGSPIAGDARYGGTSPADVDTGFFLHAARLALPPHGDDAAVVVDAPLPERFSRALAAVKLEAK